MMLKYSKFSDEIFHQILLNPNKDLPDNVFEIVLSFTSGQEFCLNQIFFLIIHIWAYTLILHTHEAFHTISPSQKHHHLRMIWNLYTFTTNCCKNILKISGHTPYRKPNYGISKFSIFLVYSCFSNPETLDKIRTFSSLIYNSLYISTFWVDSAL